MAPVFVLLSLRSVFRMESPRHHWTLLKTSFVHREWWVPLLPVSRLQKTTPRDISKKWDLEMCFICLIIIQCLKWLSVSQTPRSAWNLRHFFQELERDCPETPVAKNLPMFNKVTGVSMLEALVSERVTLTALASKKKCSYSGIPPGT